MESECLRDARVSTGKPIAPASVRTGLGADAIATALIENLRCLQGKPPQHATRNDWYMALAYTVRDRMMERYVATLESIARTNTDAKAVAYLSAEFLTGPHLGTGLINLGIWQAVDEALSQAGQDLSEFSAVPFTRSRSDRDADNSSDDKTANLTNLTQNPGREHLTVEQIKNALAKSRMLWPRPSTCDQDGGHTDVDTHRGRKLRYNLKHRDCPQQNSGPMAQNIKFWAIGPNVQFWANGQNFEWSQCEISAALNLTDLTPKQGATALFRVNIV